MQEEGDEDVKLASPAPLSLLRVKTTIFIATNFKKKPHLKKQDNSSSEIKEMLSWIQYADINPCYHVSVCCEIW